MNPTSTIILSNTELTHLLFAIVLLLFSSHIFGYFFQKMTMPRVIGEILGGLVVGPTLLGFFSPRIYTWIFNSFPAEGIVISSISWIGLILLMFISGFELQHAFKKDDRKIIVAILLGGTLLPFIAGFFFPQFYDISQLLGKENNLLALQIVIGIAIAVTSIPVISKIFIDLHIVKTHFAKIVLTIATIEDILLYALLAIATGIVSASTISTSSIATTVAISILFLAIGIVLIPKCFVYFSNLKINYLLKSSTTGYALFVCFLFAALASILHINVVFGALLAGVAFGFGPKSQFEKMKLAIKEFSFAFFIPIYFAVVGLRLDLIHSFNITFFILFLMYAIFFKLFGTILAARIVRKDWLSSFNLGIAMNARGGPGIVLATIAFDLGIINEVFFTTLVLLAIVTSLFAGYWFQLVIKRRWKLLT